MAAFTKAAKWIDWCPRPSKPAFQAPSGSVDAHCHVFGPGDRFPFAPERKYTPCDASSDQLFALRDFFGFERNVIEQATCHGAHNRSMVDALLRSNGKARGVATVRRTVTAEELESMHLAGVRGIRFNFVKRLVGAPPFDSLGGERPATWALNADNALNSFSSDSKKKVLICGIQARNGFRNVTPATTDPWLRSSL
jgi:2-pyrone-4,6-dicarboxylate lactonase